MNAIPKADSPRPLTHKCVAALPIAEVASILKKPHGKEGKYPHPHQMLVIRAAIALKHRELASTVMEILGETGVRTVAAHCNAASAEWNLPPSADPAQLTAQLNQVLYG